MNHNPIIFDRNRVRLHRGRAARLGVEDFLLTQMAIRAGERLDELNQNFPMAIELGARNGAARTVLQDHSSINQLIQCELSEPLLRQAEGLRVVADEELLPVAKERIDLCISLGSLHWVNDLPGTLIQVRHALKPGGLLLAMLPGGKSFNELRQSFEQAEMKRSGGISPRISPFVDSRDAGGLLQRAGFTDPVIDSECLTLEYDHPLKLLYELRKMGETNALIHSRKAFTSRSVLQDMATYYMQDFSNAAGRIPATLELITLTAFKPG